MNVLLFGTEVIKNSNFQKGAQNQGFWAQNQKSDTTFISLTLKVEETKVISEF